jgi:hypothetical protein
MLRRSKNLASELVVASASKPVFFDVSTHGELCPMLEVISFSNAAATENCIL